MFAKILKKVYAKINFDIVNNSYAERLSIEDQFELLSKFPEPNDDYERSFYKYKCWAEFFYHNRKVLLVFYNLGALILYPILLKKLKNNAKLVNSKECWDAIEEDVPNLPNHDVIPQDIMSSFPNRLKITSINYFDGALYETGLGICKELRRRFFFRFYFRLICALKLAQFDKYINEFKPRAIVFYSYEREFTGPLQTYLCEMQNTEFISYMHGDLLFSIAFAFQRYSVLYIWDDYYKTTLKELKCSFVAKQYTPLKLQGIASIRGEKEYEYYATYYFSNETKECAEKIKQVFDVFRSSGLRCKIRPHPRYSDINMLNHVFENYYIENPQTYCLSDSISDSLYIVGLNTTVLSQAYFSNKEVVIDDVSKPEEYDVLKKKRYIMLNRRHKLLSNLKNKPGSYDHTYKFFDIEMKSAIK